MRIGNSKIYIFFLNFLIKGLNFENFSFNNDLIFIFKRRVKILRSSEKLLTENLELRYKISDRNYKNQDYYRILNRIIRILGLNIRKIM